MFQGNKKGPLGRWDFDTQEEYSDYMNNKEALPKYVRFIYPSALTPRFSERSFVLMGSLSLQGCLPVWNQDV